MTFDEFKVQNLASHFSHLF